MQLNYSYLDALPTPIPPRQVNGGLYTGIPFAQNAPWGNVPVVPDAQVMVRDNLKSANPPPNAQFFIPSFTRPGNNEQKLTDYMDAPMLNSSCYR